MSNSKARYVSTVAIFAALAVVMALLKLEVPYPLLPYLKFDFAEVPSVIVLFMYDLRASLTVALVHFLILMIKGEFAPIGPLMKFTAIFSTILGLNLVLNSSKEVNLREIVIGMVVAMIVRCFFMTILNYIVLILLLPDLIKVASLLLKSIINMETLDDLTCILLFTGFYNALHVIMTVGLAFMIFKHMKALTLSMH